MPSKPYHHDHLRGELIRATRAVVERDGADAMTIAGVAAMCEVSVAAPYRHFAHRQALLGAVAAEGFHELRTALTLGAGASSEPAERLVASGVAYVDFALTHPHLFRLMFDADVRDPAAAAPQALDGLAALIEPLDLAVTTETALRVTWALAHGIASLRIGGMRTFIENDSPERVRDELQTLLGGIVREHGAAASDGTPASS
ncbi:TetR/AcrR family transcriptional regulator [Pseudactinotalea sp.]|uniref:TetR/AcrR family transcriptional regulator n=1 Tax=Pseudactinotalea sp. TaxID=1926260 RepID=UPI003B3B6702